MWVFGKTLQGIYIQMLSYFKAEQKEAQVTEPSSKAMQQLQGRLSHSESQDLAPKITETLGKQSHVPPPAQGGDNPRMLSIPS